MGRTTPGQGLRIKRRVTARFSVEVSLAGIEPVGFRVKSDLRNHRAIVQPRLYDCSMVTQITLKTEGPHGLPSGRQTEADPLYRGLIILTDYDCGQRFTLERTEPCANATTRERGGRRAPHELSRGTARPPRLARDYALSTIATKSG